MTVVVCKCCGEAMPRPEWEGHQCPAIQKPIPGESFADYKARCEAARAARGKR